MKKSNDSYGWIPTMQVMFLYSIVLMKLLNRNTEMLNLIKIKDLA